MCDICITPMILVLGIREMSGSVDVKCLLFFHLFLLPITGKIIFFPLLRRLTGLKVSSDSGVCFLILEVAEIIS